MEDSNKKQWVVATIILLIFIIFFANVIIKDQKELNELKREGKLIKEGKIKYSDEITEEFVEKIKEKNTNISYLSNDCKISINNKSSNLNKVCEVIRDYRTHRIEKRGNDIEDEDTYRIYWNGNDIEDAEQIITLYMKKKVMKDEIVSEVYKITISDNK